ncbi:MAG: radical SAM protein [Proteobacteria bacterium]|nr:radical SAM protein [Pseudomonadota bacterium]
MFVHAPDPLYADTQNYGALFMPVWAYTLASHVPADDRFELQLCDTRFDSLEQIEVVDVALFSGINQDQNSLIHAEAALRQRFPKMVSIIGGPICWSFNQAGDIDKLAAFDHIFIGDGEREITSLLEHISAGRPLEKVISSAKRFNMAEARPVNRALLDSTIDRYYGAVLEVSRGCPFLCEFCDIRILPDNNRPHNKAADLIVAEMDHLCRLGVRQVLFACDNFIGDPRWAEQVLDALIAWQQESGFRPGLYTWLTINLYRHPRLMKKLRQAGFDLLFIGIESFNENSLLETAKVQNSSIKLTEAIREVQSYGFIIVAGLIFGFDSDDETCFDITLNGLRDSALLSGDPSLLTALPGTPLYRRMKLAGRLRQVRYGLGGFKYQTNFKYLMPQDHLINGYRHFIRRYNLGAYQYSRLVAYMDLVGTSKNFVPLHRGGYGEIGRFLTMVLRNRRAVLLLGRRALKFCAHPANIYYALLGLLLVARHYRISGRFSYFQFWLFAWSNSVLKYQDITQDDFDIESVGADFDIHNVMPLDYEESADEPIPTNKTSAQLRATGKQLHALIKRAGLMDARSKQGEV